LKFIQFIEQKSCLTLVSNFFREAELRCSKCHLKYTENQVTIVLYTLLL